MMNVRLLTISGLIKIAWGDYCYDFCVQELGESRCSIRGSWCKNNHVCHTLMWSNPNADSRICIHSSEDDACSDIDPVTCDDALRQLGTTTVVPSAESPRTIIATSTTIATISSISDTSTSTSTDSYTTTMTTPSSPTTSTTTTTQSPGTTATSISTTSTSTTSTTTSTSSTSTTTSTSTTSSSTTSTSTTSTMSSAGTTEITTTEQFFVTRSNPSQSMREYEWKDRKKIGTSSIFIPLHLDESNPDSRPSVAIESEDGQSTLLILDTSDDSQSILMNARFGSVKSLSDESVVIPVPDSTVLAAGPLSDFTVLVETFGYTKGLLILQEDKDDHWLNYCKSSNWLMVSDMKKRGDFFATDRAIRQIVDVHNEDNLLWTVSGSVRLNGIQIFSPEFDYIIDTSASPYYHVPKPVFNQLIASIESLGGTVRFENSNIFIHNCAIDMPSLVFKFGSDQDALSFTVSPFHGPGPDGKGFLRLLDTGDTCELLVTVGDTHAMRFPTQILDSLFTVFNSDAMTVSFCFPRIDSMKPLGDPEDPEAILVDRTFDLDTLKPFVHVVIDEDTYSMSLETAYGMDFLYTSGSGQDEDNPFQDDNDMRFYGYVSTKVRIGSFEFFYPRMHLVHTDDQLREMEGDGVISCSFSSVFANSVGVFALYTAWEGDRRSWLILGERDYVGVSYLPIQVRDDLRQEWFVEGSVRTGGHETKVTWIIDSGVDTIYDVPRNMFESIRNAIEITGARIDIDSGIIDDCSVLKKNYKQLPHILYKIGDDVMILVKPTSNSQLDSEGLYEVVHSGYISYSDEGGEDTCRLLVTGGQSYVESMDAYKLPFAVLDSLFIVFDKKENRLGFRASHI